MIRELIDSRPMSRYQFAVVLTCVVLFTIEGYDVMVMAFAAPGLAAVWHLSASQIGLLLSSGLVGMALGSAFVAPLADRIGRRPLSLVCLTVSTLGMALGALSGDVMQLGLNRVLTGIGIGGLVASLPVLIAEYTPTKRRGSMIALYSVGLPLGGVLGGIVATIVSGGFGWRGLFWTGAALTLLMLGVVAAMMPESLDYLIAKSPRGALTRINVILPRMGLDPVAQLPDRGTDAPVGVRSAVFSKAMRARTVLLWISFFIMMAAFYFAAGWTPRLLQQSGLSAQQGINGGLLFNLGGIVASLGLAALALFFDKRVLASLAFVATGVTFTLLSLALGNGLTLVLLAAGLVGIATGAAAAGLFTIIPDMYPAAVRVTAVGWAAAAGRLGAIASPVLVGLLLDAGWTPSAVLILFAVPTAMAGLAILGVSGTKRDARVRPRPQLSA